jgi:SPX domain protein involved in polyphosphate accumulation
MSILVFNRFESKYILDEQTFQLLLDQLLEHMERDAFHQNDQLYTVCSVYFDTMSNELVRQSIARPRYKEKLRIRSYGIPNPGDKVYLELKKKVSGRVNKRRVGLTTEQALAFVMQGNFPTTTNYMERQVTNEIAYFLSRYQLQPKVYLAYDRLALFSRVSRDLRITFDRNLRSRRDDLRLDSGDHGQLLLGDGQWLMEVKTEQTMPLWLARLLSDVGLRKVRFSKYGNEYFNMIQQQRTQEGAITYV